MTTTEQTTRARKATKTIFLICGLGVSSWAPMVPYAKERLALNDANLGVLLLMLGVGAIVVMPLCGLLANRFGSRIVILCAAIVMALTLPLLLLMTSPIWMGVALFIFGAGVGTVDVAMNAHGVQVQNLSPKPIMSSLHGLFSVGGLIGALVLGLLIKLGLAPVTAAIAIGLLLILIVSFNYKNLFDYQKEKAAIHQFSFAAEDSTTSSFSWLTGSVLFLGALCFATFLSEGAMLDWSAIFLRESRGVAEELTGIGYASFSVAMATMRLLGDKIVARLNGKTVVIAGALIAASGLLLVVLTPWIATALLGFILLGIGAANIVPVLFSEGGRLKNVPSTVAIPAITSMGYAGSLAGPALLGFLAHQFSLPIALGFLSMLLILVGIAYALKKS